MQRADYLVSLDLEHGDPERQRGRGKEEGDSPRDPVRRPEMFAFGSRDVNEDRAYPRRRRDYGGGPEGFVHVQPPLLPFLIPCDREAARHEDDGEEHESGVEEEEMGR